MNTFLFLTSVPKPPPVRHALLDFSSPEGFVVFGAIAVLVLVLTGWVYFYYTRKREGHKRGHRHHHEHRHERHHHEAHEDEEEEAPQHSDHASRDHDEDLDADEPGDEAQGEGLERRRRRRRRRRRDHRPRNPTLAETGGLPPIRTEAPPGP